MILIENIVQLCRSIFCRKKIEYEIVEEEIDEEMDCHCNLCYLCRNFCLFGVRRLREVKVQ